MGGHNAGEIAALEAVNTVCQLVREADLSLSSEKIAQFLRLSVAQANERVWKLSLQDQTCTGMGTTLCCFMIHDESLIYAHIGDSRLYRYRGQLEQLTKDHSLYSTLIDQGEIEDAENLPNKHVITRALGTTSHVLPDIGILSTLPNDLYFLCSDGLTDMVSDDEIASILSLAPSIEDAVYALVNTALEKGGNDNITVLMVKLMI
jgi:protein phosphatase